MLSKLGEFLAYALLRAFMFPFQIVPLRVARSMGAALGLFAYYVAPIRKKIVEKNLRFFFEKEWSETQIKAGVRNAYRSFGIALAEFAFNETIDHDNVERYVKIEGFENYQAAHAMGKPVVLYGSHQAMWEWSQNMLHWAHEPFYVVMKRIHNRYIDQYSIERRSVFGAKMLSQRGAIAALSDKSIKAPVNLAFFVDQRAAKGKGVFIEVAGQPVSAMVGPALMALRGDLPVAPVEMIRTDFGLIIRYHPVIDFTPTGDQAVDLQRLTQLINDRVTEWIRRNPADYFWLHDRFKIHPSEKDAAEAFRRTIATSATVTV
jgi:KDO2-lipid IV(A) lauroyltransferase